MFVTSRNSLFRRSLSGLVFRTEDGPRVELRGLTEYDAKEHAGHLKRLSPQDRRLRFHSMMSDNAVALYSRRMDWQHALAFGIFIDGTLRGVDIYYFPGSYSGQRAANIAVRRFKEIYPLPDKVRALSTTRLGEVDKVNAPSLFMEIGYHDNEEDANWVADNLDTIAKALGQTLAEYFGQPFVNPIQPQQATVSTSGSNLNLRARPSTSAAVIGSIPRGAKVTVYGLLPEWASVSYNNNIGFVNRKFLNI